MVMVANLPVLASKEAKAMERPLSFVLCLLNIERGRRRKRHILFNTEHSHKIVVQNKDKSVKSVFIRYCRKYQ